MSAVTTCTKDRAHHWKVAANVDAGGEFRARCKRRGCGATRSYPSLIQPGGVYAPRVVIADLPMRPIMRGDSTRASRAATTVPLTSLRIVD